MKVIGKTERGFILEASEDEIANLVGEYYWSAVERKVKIGSTINVKKMYDRIQHLRNAAGSLQEFRNKMRHIMKLTEPLDRIVENLGKTGEKNNA